MKKTIKLLSIFFITFYSFSFADAIKIISDDEMARKYAIVFEGTVKKIESYHEEREDTEQEKFLKLTKFRALISVTKEIKSDLKSEDEVWILFEVPGPSYGNYSKLFNHVEIDKYYRVYANNFLLKDSKKTNEIHLQSEGQIRLGNVEESLSHGEANKKLRRVAINKAKSASRSKNLNVNGAEQDFVNPEEKNESLPVNREEKILEPSKSINRVFWAIAILFFLGVSLLLFKVFKGQS